MLEAIQISLIITAIHVCFLSGMIFEKIAVYLQRLPIWIRKPLFECLICMGGLWTLILQPICFGYFSFFTLLTVIGLNTIITSLIKEMYE